MKNKKLQNIEKHGFSIPKNYFEEFELGILHALTSDETENEVIFDLAEKNPFSVPTSYFTETEEKIIRTITSEKISEVKVIPIYRRKSFYTTAASIAAVLVLFLGIFNFEKTADPTSLNDIEISSLEMYIDNEDMDFSTSEITTFFEQGTITTDMDISEIENSDLLEYLDEHTMDNTYLIE
ncbi:MAG TPA: hypothetical protein VFM70_07945 [Salinimicrobium sp.]|nr:hypothetical protein [Salinimicrobium sp.]